MSILQKRIILIMYVLDICVACDVCVCVCVHACVRASEHVRMCARGCVCVMRHHDTGETTNLAGALRATWEPIEGRSCSTVLRE